MKLNCIVIDDEQLARIGMIKYIEEVPFLNLMGDFQDPLQALPMLRGNVIDLMFLDIQMPKMTGIEFLQSMTNPPMVIITTAYSNHALKGFELDVIDYLLKPIPFERFAKAAVKARDYAQLQIKPEENMPASDYFFIKCENRIEKISYDDFIFAEAQQNYVVVHTAKKKYISYLPFNRLESFLPGDRFLKVNKSCIVSIAKIDSIIHDNIVVGSNVFPVSRSRKDEIMNNILGNKLLKR